MRQRLDDREFAPHAERVGRHRIILPLPEAEPVEEHVEPLPDDIGGETVGSGKEPGILVPGQGIPVTEVVEEHTDLPE